MTVHRVLVERDEDVNLVSHIADRRLAGADGQERMPTADDGLVGIVSVEMKSAPREDAGQNVARRGDALTVLTSNGNCEIGITHNNSPGAPAA